MNIFVDIMGLQGKYDINRLRDYSELFSRREATRWLNADWSGLNTKLTRYEKNISYKSTTYLSYLKLIYRRLEEFYPNEYVYKNSFISNCLLKESHLLDNKIYSELRLGKSIADLAVFNGISKVFEIKTLLDKETRLENQLYHYSRLFNEVYIVVPEQKEGIYSKKDTSFGIITYKQDSKSFTIVRAAERKINIDINIMMEMLHTNEYIQIVAKYYRELPRMNDFNKFRVCKDLIKAIPVIELNRLFIEVMKERKRNNYFSQTHKQFNQLFLSMNFSKEQNIKILSNLRTKIS